MNLFVLDQDPKIAAAHNCDRHVIKIILEAAQMLGTAHRIVNHDSRFKAIYANHPVTMWVRASRENYIWTTTHALGLCNEYTRRYLREHTTQEKILWFHENIPTFTKRSLTPFAQAMPDDCKSDDAVEAYRKYYKLHKADLATWKFGPPVWW